MKKITKNILIFGLILSMLALCACNETPEPSNEPDGPITLNVEDFVIFEDFKNNKNLQESFVEANPTALFTKEYFDYDAREWVYPPDYPTKRAILIQSQSEYDQVFSAAVDPEPMDYTKEMYVLCTFTTHTTYPKLITTGAAAGYFSGYTFVIEGAVIDGKELQIDCNMKYVYEGDPSIIFGGVESYQRFALIRMDKKDVENIVFKLKGNPL